MLEAVIKWITNAAIANQDKSNTPQKTSIAANVDLSSQVQQDTMQDKRPITAMDCFMDKIEKASYGGE